MRSARLQEGFKGFRREAGRVFRRTEEQGQSHLKRGQSRIVLGGRTGQAQCEWETQGPVQADAAQLVMCGARI